MLGRGRFLLAILCLTVAPAPGIFSQQANPPKDLLVVEERFRQALLSRDTEVLASILTDDFVRSPPNAAPETGKFEYIEAIRSGKGRYFTIESHDAKYRLYGDVVLENVVWNVTYGQEANKSFSLTRALLVWVKQASGWKLASLQGNSAPER
jgi:ketosteroid isomerase-like protein